MENIDFDSLMFELNKESAIENIEKYLSELKETKPQVYGLFDAGRRFGRSEIIGQLLKIVMAEREDMLKFIQQNRDE